MMKFIGKNVGDPLVEYYGPINGRNYNTAGSATPIPPTIEVEVSGTGSVQVMQTNVSINQPNDGYNSFTYDTIGDQTTYVNLGPVVTAASGVVTVTPSVDNKFASIRIVMASVGTGTFTARSIWN